MNLLFIVNPVAGKGLASRSIPQIKEYCSTHSFKCTIMETKYRGHGTALAREFFSSSYDGIVAAGGDGTVREVASALIGSSIPLGILPLGTGNDLARSFNLPKDLLSALSVIANKSPVPVDVGRSDDFFFLNVASVGLDAEIVRFIAKVKGWLPRKAAYYISALIKFLTYKTKTVRLEIDGKLIKTKVLFIAIANGTHYGGGMKVNPNGSISDGFFDVILVRPVPRYKIPFLMATFASGKHLNLPYVTLYRCKDINIYSDESLVVNGDGDIVATTPVDFSMLKGSIHVFA